MVRRRLLLGGKSFAQLTAEDGWLLDLRMDGAGSGLTNYGTATSLTITPSNLTFEAAGLPKLGGTSVDFASATSVITINNNAQLNALQAFSYLILFNADTVGGGSGARLFHWHTPDDAIINIQNDGSLQVRFNRASVNASWTTGAAELTFPTGPMALVVTGDVTNGLALYKSVGNALVPISTGTPTVGSGVYNTFTAPLRVGNQASVNRALDGRVYRAMVRSGVLSPGRISEYIKAAL